MNSPILNFLPFLIPVAFIVFAIFLVVAIIEARSAAAEKSGAIKSFYYYFTCFLALIISVAAFIFLFQLGLKSWVFTQAEQVSNNTPPPGLYLTTGKVEPVGGQQAYSCQNGCEFTETDKSQIVSWAENYKQWRKSQDVSAQRQRDAVGAFSFLIVTLPLFFIYFRQIQKENKEHEKTGKKSTLLRPTYFYTVSLASLLMAVISGALLINLGLKTFVFPKAYDAYQNTDKYDTSMASYDKAGVISLENCREKCDFTEEQKATAKNWLADYQQWQSSSASKETRQQTEASNYLPILLAALPLFWFHWKFVRKEKPEINQTQL